MTVHELSSIDQKDPFSAKDIIDFLFDHLDQYGDERQAITKCVDYVFNRGGFILFVEQEGVIVGATIINDTGMQDYIPEHILVYIAVNADFRGQGIGKILMNSAIDRCEGDIALHVEADNPAVHLYKKMGFTNKYLEMRYSRS